MAGVPWTMCVRLLLTVALLQTARASDVRQRLYKRNAAMDGLQLTSTALFQASERSTLQCGIRCSREKCCLSFAFNAEQPSSCRGYDVAMTSSTANDTVSAAGTESFELADWLGTPCSQNSECPVCQSECFKGQCLCTPGYYYSEGSKACFADCPQADLGDGFVKYSGSAFSLVATHLSEEHHKTSLSVCKDKCLNTFPTCHSLNYHPGDTWCGLLTHTALNTDFGIIMFTPGTTTTR